VHSEDEEPYTLEEFQRTWMSKLNNTHCVFISAQHKENVDELRNLIYERVKEIFKVRYPYNNFLY